MPGPDDPRSAPPRTSGWGWTALPATPWWRQGARLLGVDDDLDRATAALRQAGTWLDSVLPAAPQFKPEVQQRFDAAQAADAQRGAAGAAAVGNFARRIMGSEPVQQLGESIASQFRPTPETTAMLDMAQQAVTAHSNRLRETLLPGAQRQGASGPAWTGAEPLDKTLGFLNETLPNFALDVARDMSTPGGALSNLDLPVAQALPFLAKAGGALSHAALPPGFYSKVERIAEKIPAKGVAPTKLQALLQGGGATAEELGHRQVNEFITQRMAEGNRPITRAEFAAHLDAHPLPDVEFHTQGGPPAPDPPHTQYFRELSAKYNGRGGIAMATPEENAKLDALWKEFQEGPEPPQRVPPSYGKEYQEDLQLPGGKHYGEYLTSVPQPTAKQGRHRIWISKADDSPEGYSIVHTNENVPTAELQRLQERYTAPYTVHSEEIETPIGGAYTAGHYGHIPNVIGSARVTERTLPASLLPDTLPEGYSVLLDKPTQRFYYRADGLLSHPEYATEAEATRAAAAHAASTRGEKGVFGEEFQSDLHREGRTAGYVQPPSPEYIARRAELVAQREEVKRLRDEAALAHDRAEDAYHNLLDETTRGFLPLDYAHLKDVHQVMSDTSAAGRTRKYAVWQTAREGALQTPQVQAAKAALTAAEQASTEATEHASEVLRATREEHRALTAPPKPGAVPDLPFKGDEWLDLELKRQLQRVAHDPEASWFGWSGGQTIADRYDLSKYVDELTFVPDDPGDYSIGALVGRKDGRNVVRKEGVTHEEFKKYMNKDLADALSAQVRERGERQAAERYQWSIDEAPEGGYHLTGPTGEPLRDPAGTALRYADVEDAQNGLDQILSERRWQAAADHPKLTGEELRFGSKWPFQLYDETTRRKVEKLVKPFGAKVEPLAEVPGSGRRGVYQFRAPRRAPGGPIPGIGDPVGPQFESIDAARAWRPGWEGQGYTIEEVAAPKPGEPGWITRFTPEQKRRMRDEGFSFMSMLPPAALGAGAAAGASADPDDPDQQAATSDLPFDLSRFAQVGLAGMPFFPGGRRPYLNKAGQRTIADLRHVLGQEALKGPVSPETLGRVLREAPLGYAHRVSKDLPVPPALGSMSRILSPGDLGFDFAPAVTERVHQMAGIGQALPHQANWGGATDPAILPGFNNDRRAADLFGRMFASASPRTSVPKNALENLNIWRDYLRSPGRPFTDERLRGLGVGNVRSKTDNINRAISGFDPSGEKVDLFTDYMTGRAQFPVPDVHWLYGIGSKHGSIDSVLPEIRELADVHYGIPRERALDPKDYVHMLNDASARALQSWSPGQNMGPLFGSTWEGIRAQKGLGFQGGMIDLYEPHGLTERGAMFDDRMLSEAIKNWGGR